MAVDRPASASTSTRALWYVGRGAVELRPEPLGRPGEGEVLVRTLFSGVSRGTERLVLNGGVAESEWQRMRAPLQVGAFPFPVKYGYCATGRVEAGTKELLGRNVFVLHPHQERFVVPAGLAVPIPDSVPTRRATLAANMETALNAVWDSGAGPADRIVVVGAGIVGLLVGYLCARLPDAEVTLVDIAKDRRPIAQTLGIGFDEPQRAPTGADIVLHTSATADGLDTAITAAGLEATIVELSWFGDGTTPVKLGGAFHSRRLKLVSSQVGQVAPSRRPRWGYRRRLEAALRLLGDPALDSLLESEIAFDEAPARLPALLAPGAPGLAPIIRYPEA
jgi:threonine dehydrogenase-like Zn-dependent dehydrogenase